VNTNQHWIRNDRLQLLVRELKQLENADVEKTSGAVKVKGTSGVTAAAILVSPVVVMIAKHDTLFRSILLNISDYSSEAISYICSFYRG